MLTPKQIEAYDVAASGGRKVIAGYAGTGKTVVLSELAKNINYDVLAPTNKAAQVLRNKGIARAKTIHSAIYMPNVGKDFVQDENGNRIPEIDEAGNLCKDDDGQILFKMRETLSFSMKDEVDVAEGCFVDEASMISQQVIQDLVSAYPNIIVFGDPMQLPPVRAQSVFKGAKVDVFLDEVHRVAMGNPITAFATSIRLGQEDRSLIDNENIFHIKKNSDAAMLRFVEDKYKLICWSNKMRHSLNTKYRAALGYDAGCLMEDEDLIVLKSIYGEGGQMMAYNGLEGRSLMAVGSDDTRQRLRLDTTFGQVWTDAFWKAEIEAKEIDYAYAITCHKAQGSEWDHVAVFDQRKGMRSDATEWFYTSVTRAKSKLVLVGG